MLQDQLNRAFAKAMECGLPTEQFGPFWAWVGYVKFGHEQGNMTMDRVDKLIAEDIPALIREYQEVGKESAEAIGQEGFGMADEEEGRVRVIRNGAEGLQLVWRDVLLTLRLDNPNYGLCGSIARHDEKGRTKMLEFHGRSANDVFPVLVHGERDLGLREG